MSKGFIAVTLVFMVASAQSQHRADSSRSYYIQSYTKYFLAYPVLKYRSLSFEVRNASRARQKVAFTPNNTSSFGMGMYVFDLSIELTVAIPMGEKKKKIYGETDAQDLQLNILTKSWSFDVYHQKYAGFYKDDARVDIPKNVPYPQRPDIHSLNFGVAGSYAFNKGFSLRAPYNFVDRQLKSKGSFLMYGTLNSFEVSADSALLSPAVRENIGKQADFKKLRYTTLSLAPGYSYTFVYKRLFVNGTFAVGPANHWIYYKKDNGTDQYDINVNATYSLRVGVGYNSSRFFGGFGLSLQSRVVRFEDVVFENSSTTLKFLMGYRFKKKGIFEKHVWDFLPHRKKN